MNNHSDKYSKVFDICIKEMFLRVGEESNPFEFAKQDRWYCLHSWTEEQQKTFQNWMVLFLRKELKYTKKQALFESGMFIIDYGWTTVQNIEFKSTIT